MAVIEHKCTHPDPGSVFMRPEVVHGEMYVLEGSGFAEELSPCPVDVFNPTDVLCKPGDSVEITLESGYWSRLQAPGYLDATGWQGPYESEEKALKELAESYDVCLECWEQCWELF